MGAFLLAHVGIPFLAGLVFLFMTGAAGEKPVSLESCNEIALDFNVLSIGATGAIFLNDRIIVHWKELTGIYGITVVLVNLLLASLLVYRRRWRQPPTTNYQAFWDLVFGAFALGVTLAAFWFGYNGDANVANALR
jgi:hypothetical protein